MNINIYPLFEEFSDLLKLYPPVKARDFLPDWYKKQPKFNREDLFFGPTVPGAKMCPALTYEITEGIILPAWSDVIIRYNNNKVRWHCPVGDITYNNPHANEFEWLSTHVSSQTDEMGLNVGTYGAIKLNSPYLIQTDNGIHTKFTDVTHHLRKDVRFISGTVETDIWHMVNFPFEFTKPPLEVGDDTVIIKAGDPLLMLTPVVANIIKPTVTIKEYNQDFIDRFRLDELKQRSQSLSWVRYKQYKKGSSEYEEE